MAEIDSTTYPKSVRFPRGHGYTQRGTRPSSIVIHTTNGPRPNTSFEAEARFLFESPKVSAHYLVSKTGKIVEFLRPLGFQAWHAGGLQADGSWSALPAWSNARSIGIEIHYSIGDPRYPVLQEDAVTELVRSLMAEFAIPPSMVETHRTIALPAGRKVDPSGWSDADFYIWRSGLVAAAYRVVAPMWVSETPSPRGPIALDGRALVRAGETVMIDEVRPDGWAHLQNGLGFLAIGGLEKL